MNINFYATPCPECHARYVLTCEPEVDYPDLRVPSVVAGESVFCVNCTRIISWDRATNARAYYNLKRARVMLVNARTHVVDCYESWVTLNNLVITFDDSIRHNGAL